MQIDNKRVANLRCSEYFTQRHISQKCQLNTFEIIMNFFVNINIILKEIEWKNFSGTKAIVQNTFEKLEYLSFFLKH